VIGSTVIDDRGPRITVLSRASLPLTFRSLNSTFWQTANSDTLHGALSQPPQLDCHKASFGSGLREIIWETFKWKAEWPVLFQLHALGLRGAETQIRAD